MIQAAECSLREFWFCTGSQDSRFKPTCPGSGTKDWDRFTFAFNVRPTSPGLQRMSYKMQCLSSPLPQRGAGSGHGQCSDLSLLLLCAQAFLHRNITLGFSKIVLSLSSTEFRKSEVLIICMHFKKALWKLRPATLNLRRLRWPLQFSTVRWSLSLPLIMGSPGSLLEVQTPRLHLDLPNQNLHLTSFPQVLTPDTV